MTEIVVGVRTHEECYIFKDFHTERNSLSGLTVTNTLSHIKATVIAKKKQNWMTKHCNWFRGITTTILVYADVL